MNTLRISLFILGLSVVSTTALAQADGDSTAAVSESLSAVPERAMGQAEAPVRIDLYVAFNCVTCSQWYLSVLPELKARHIDSGEARLVFHDVAIEPIEHSVRAAMIGLCAAPTHFFEVAQSFMSGQAVAKADKELIPQWYLDAIAVSGRDADDIDACIAKESTYNLVVAQNSDPEAAALPDLPGILVNGRLVRDPTLENISAAIADAPRRVAD